MLWERVFGGLYEGRWIKKWGMNGGDAEEGCGWIGCCVFEGAFTKQSGEGIGGVRVVI